MYVHHVIIQTASMRLDTEAFNKRIFPNVLKEERSYTADHIKENGTVSVVSMIAGEQGIWANVKRNLSIDDLIK